MNEIQYIEYFEALATKNTTLAHCKEQRSFFCINNPYETNEFDNALRSSAASTVLLLDAPAGYLSDNGTANFTQTTKFDFLLVGKASKENIRSVRAHCFQLGLDILARISTDAAAKTIIAGRNIYFMNESIQYDVVGPINLSYYGYSFSFNFCCPFSFSTQRGTWSDSI